MTAISQTQSLVAKTVIGWSLFNDERETLIIMTRLPLRQFFLQNASLGAQSYYLSPWMVAVQCASDYVQSCEGNDLYGASLPQMGVLGWIQMWLRMALGLQPIERQACSDDARYNATRISHKQVRSNAVRKPAAQNLAALMRFAPDAHGAGLTLNQYRERFTRLSVLGRVRIYHALAVYRRRGGKRRGLRLRGVLTPHCNAILWPD